MKNKILVTGGVGFIGSHLVDKLIDLGHEVTVIDDLSSGKRDNLNHNAKLEVKDICNFGLLDYQLFKGIDYVFHLAAIPGVPYSVKNPLRTHDVNITGTLNVLKASLENKVKKVIFASTAALYGDCDHPAKEDDPVNSQSPYAFQKIVGEGYMKLFSEVYGLPTLSLRFFNVYGKRCSPDSPYALVIPIFKALKKRGDFLTIYGDGEQTRDFVYVSDIVDALILAMEKPVQNEVINVCSGESVSINQLADLIGGQKIYLPPREGDVLYTLGSNEKALKLLNWKPKILIKEGLELMEK